MIQWMRRISNIGVMSGFRLHNEPTFPTAKKNWRETAVHLPQIKRGSIRWRIRSLWRMWWMIRSLRQDESPGSNATGEAGKAIVRACLAIGDTVLIGNDVPASVFEKIRSVYIYISVDSSEEAERVYKLLAEDGQVYMPLEENFFATRFSQLRDRFGVSWSIIHEHAMAQ